MNRLPPATHSGGVGFDRIEFSVHGPTQQETYRAIMELIAFINQKTASERKSLGEDVQRPGGCAGCPD